MQKSVNVPVIVLQGEDNIGVSFRPGAFTVIFGFAIQNHSFPLILNISIVLNGLGGQTFDPSTRIAVFFVSRVSRVSRTQLAKAQIKRDPNVVPSQYNRQKAPLAILSGVLLHRRG